MNLIRDPWWPARGVDGSIGWIGLGDLMRGSDLFSAPPALSDPLLDEAASELAAAILWLLVRPHDEGGWRRVWTENGADVELSRLDGIAACFDLFTGMRAFQDPTVGNLPEKPISGLFHSAPGDQTKEHNKDIGSPGPRGLSPAAAAVALYAMQAHAHAGGPGFRTSVAGGGPLRTVPRMGGTLFRQLWAMVLHRSSHERGIDPSRAALPDRAALPWVMSPGPRPVAERLHPLLVLFATPRRILLSPPRAEGTCDLTGTVGPLVTHYREGQNGPEYSAGGFVHPWTPVRGEAGKPLPILSYSRPALFGWRDWAGVVTGRRLSEKVVQAPASAVAAWDRARLDFAAGRGSTLRVSAYGVRCEQAKVLGFVRSTHAFDVVAEEDAEIFQSAMEGAVVAVERIAQWLVGAVRDVVNDGSKDRKDPTERNARGRSDVFWSVLDRPGQRFSHSVARALGGEADDLPAATLAASKELHQAACRAAVMVFDEATGDAILQPDTAARAAAARGRLVGMLHGRVGRDLFGLPDMVALSGGSDAVTEEIL